MTRRPSLAGRLSRALAACVALALIVMVAASTLVMRSWMLANMDSELHRLSQRAGEHLDVEDAPDAELDSDVDRTRGRRPRSPVAACLAPVGRSFPVVPPGLDLVGPAFPRAPFST